MLFPQTLPRQRHCELHYLDLSPESMPDYSMPRERLPIYAIPADSARPLALRCPHAPAPARSDHSPQAHPAQVSGHLRIVAWPDLLRHEPSERHPDHKAPDAIVAPTSTQLYILQPHHPTYRL